MRDGLVIWLMMRYAEMCAWCDDTMTWFDDLVRWCDMVCGYGTMSSWYDLMMWNLWYEGMAVWRYDIVICHNTMMRCSMTIWAMWRYNVVRWYDDVRCYGIVIWFDMLTRCDEMMWCHDCPTCHGMRIWRYSDMMWCDMMIQYMWQTVPARCKNNIGFCAKLGCTLTACRSHKKTSTTT